MLTFRIKTFGVAGSAIFLFWLAHRMSAEPLLACVMAGIVTANYRSTTPLRCPLVIALPPKTLMTAPHGRLQKAQPEEVLPKVRARMCAHDKKTLQVKVARGKITDYSYCLRLCIHSL